jgi:hypothetical protein
VARKRVTDLEALVLEYRQRESGHIVTGNFGAGGISEEDIQDV